MALFVTLTKLAFFIVSSLCVHRLDHRVRRVTGVHCCAPPGPFKHGAVNIGSKDPTLGGRAGITKAFQLLLSSSPLSFVALVLLPVLLALSP